MTTPMNKLRQFQKNLRKSQTETEARLWYHLRNRKLNGIKFRRQRIVKNYIVDFICLEKKLIIELDGGQHASQTSYYEMRAYDNIRTQKLQNEGFKVLRFWNNEVFNNLDSVLEMIYYSCLNNPSPAPSGHPLPKGEREKSSVPLSPKEREKSSVPLSPKEREKSSVPLSPKEREKSSVPLSPKEKEKIEISLSPLGRGCPEGAGEG